MMGSWPVIVSGLVQGLGMGLIFIPLNTMAFATLGSTYRTDGASLLNLVRSVGASVGISVVTTLLGSNTQRSHEDLVAHITSSSIALIDPSTSDRLGSLRSEEHTSELQSLMRISYAVFCLKKKK